MNRRSPAVALLAIAALLTAGLPALAEPGRQAPGASDPAASGPDHVTKVTLSTTSSSWMATGITLDAGQEATLKVAGDGKCGAGSDCPAGDPNGSGHTCAGRSLGPLEPGPVPSAAYGSVVVKVGSQNPQQTGAATTVTGPGAVRLVYNDCKGYYGDNSGSFHVKITLRVTISGRLVDTKGDVYTGYDVVLDGDATVSTTPAGRFSFETTPKVHHLSSPLIHPQAPRKVDASGGDVTGITLKVPMDIERLFRNSPTDGVDLHGVPAAGGAFVIQARLTTHPEASDCLNTARASITATPNTPDRHAVVLQPSTVDQRWCTGDYLVKWLDSDHHVLYSTTIFWKVPA